MVLTKTFPFEIKTDAATIGRFTGRASVYGVTDAYQDVVMPGAFTKTLQDHGGEIIVLNQHNPSDPIGRAKLEDSDTALLADGQLVLDLPSAKEMHTRVLNNLVSGISIGYQTIKESFAAGVRQLNQIELLEISLVTFPANQFARVTDVKGLLASVKDDRLAQMVLEVLPDVKAGRILSATNRQKITDIMQVLQDLIDATDPDKAQAHAAETAALNTLLTTLRGLRAAA